MTGAFALPAGFGTNTAVPVTVCMLVALIGAQAAEIGASLQHPHQQGGRGCGSPRQNRPRHGTGIGTVEVEANAAGEVRCAGLGEAGIGAGHAGLGTVEAGLYTLHEDVVDATGRFGMAGQHLAHMHRSPVCSRTRHQRQTRQQVTGTCLILLTSLPQPRDLGPQRRKLAINRSPVVWLFSGWNCVPARLSRPTTAVIGPP